MLRQSLLYLYGWFPAYQVLNLGYNFIQFGFTYNSFNIQPYTIIFQRTIYIIIYFYFLMNTKNQFIFYTKDVKFFLV